MKTFLWTLLRWDLGNLDVSVYSSKKLVVTRLVKITTWLILNILKLWLKFSSFLSAVKDAKVKFHAPSSYEISRTFFLSKLRFYDSECFQLWHFFFFSKQKLFLLDPFLTLSNVNWTLIELKADWFICPFILPGFKPTKAIIKTIYLNSIHYF